MATIIHIHELYSEQCYEVINDNTESCLWAYAQLVAFRWDELESAKFYYYRNPRTPNHIKCAVFMFNQEILTLERVNGSNIWRATWEWL